MIRFPLVCLALGLLLPCIGCGDSLVQVSGKVTLDGNPLTTGNISFAPIQPGQGQVAIGTIDAKGNYTLQSGTKNGVPTGSYRVTVVAIEMIPPTPGNPEPLPKVLTPPRYNDPNTSDLKAEVKPGSNTHNFDLKSTP